MISPRAATPAMASDRRKHRAARPPRGLDRTRRHPCHDPADALGFFWGPMAIAIMGGLIVATVLTLFFLPALYAALVPGAQR